VRTELEALVRDPALRASMAAAARTIARPDAAARVAALVEQHARGSRPHEVDAGITTQPRAINENGRP
jgi:hypothetical protein